MQRRFIQKSVLILFCVTVVLVVVYLLLGNGIFNNLINKHFQHRQILLDSGKGSISLTVPSYLRRIDEIETGQSVFSNIKQTVGPIFLHSPDIELDINHYQARGVDFMLQLDFPWRFRSENIPIDIAQMSSVDFGAGTVDLYIYPGADGNGNGRGQLGSVHQGSIRFYESFFNPNDIGLSFYCYDHSSGDEVSTRCEEIVRQLLRSVKVHRKLFFVTL